MSFLNPSILLGLFAISIPILIHLLNLRKIRKVEFSTLMFLKEIQKSKMRRIKLKQLILLMLRILTIIFLVLCFARPVYEGYAGDKDNASNSTVLIFIDDSFSMSARDDKGTLLNQAKESVKKILGSYKESDEVYFIRTSQIGLKDTKISYENFKDILDSVDNIKVTYLPLPMTGVMNYAKEILVNSRNTRSDIYIISDFQKNNFNQNVISSDDFSELNNKSSNTYLIRIGNREIKNISLDSFEVATKLLEKDKDIKVKIFLNNHSQFNVKNKSVNLYIGSELKDEKAVDINSFDNKELEFIFKTTEAGNINGTLELVQSVFEDDEFIQDNKYYFSIYIPEKFNIAVIEDNPLDSYFINLAIQTASDILSDSIKRESDLFNISSGKLIDENIFRNEVIFISDKKMFSEEEANILMRFISAGGGVFLFLGSSTDINNYNNTILSKLGSVRLEKLSDNIEQNKNLKFDKVDFEHPVLSEVFLNQKLNITSDDFNIDSPEIRNYYDLIPGENANSIIMLTNNKPFLLESGLSKGKIIISSVSATDDFSNLPLKNIFLPLIIRSIYYLSNNFEYQKTYVVGRSNLISVKGLRNISDIILPDSSRTGTGAGLNADSDNYLFLPYNAGTSQIGNYTITDSSGSAFNFPLNVDPLESNPLYMGDAELSDYFIKNKIEKFSIMGPGENISEKVDETRTGFSLWKYFLAGAILFVIAEMLLSK
ncbi:MAG: BatA domain-containing protein, partial [Bacteroidota bacterium]|nr:BatA domain-containing protein [Bacteroidota bacterium]